MEVKHESTNPANEPFVLASQVKQVYYLPYACKSDPNLNKWWIAYKVRPPGSLPIPSLDDYNAEETPSNVDDVYQEDALDGVSKISINIGDGLDNLTINENDEIVNPKELEAIKKRQSEITPKAKLPISAPFEEEETNSDAESEDGEDMQLSHEDIDDF